MTKSLSGEYISLLIQDEEYGVSPSQVRGIVDIPVIRKVPKVPSFIEGVANIRGRIVPLLNTIERFELLPSEESEEEAQKRLVLVQLDNSLYGFIPKEVKSDVLSTNN